MLVAPAAYNYTSSLLKLIVSDKTKYDGNVSYQNMYKIHTKISRRRNALLNSHTMIAGAYEPTKAYQRG